MILKVSDLIPIVAGLVDDPDQDFATTTYLMPKFQAAQNKLIVSLLSNPNIGDLKAVVEVPGVTAGTRSLQAFGAMNPGQPLELLKDILEMEEKVATFQPYEYTPMTRVYKLPNIVPGATNQIYAWIGQDVLLPGATSDVDIRIYGSFEPAPLINGDSVLMPGTAAIIQYRVAETIAALRGNLSLSQKYKEDADNSEDAYFNNLIMAQQSISIRQKAYPRTGYELRYL